jgi:Domain of unknown function (DUF397)
MDLSRINWRKASYSTNNGGECVEVGTVPRLVAVRDSKDPQGPALTFHAEDWTAFTRRMKRAASVAA